MRELIHHMVGLFFWLVFIGMWTMLLVGGGVSLSNIVDSVQYVAVVSGAVLVLTLWWIRHNVAIHRAKGPRRGRPGIPPRIDADRLGRPLQWSVPGGHAGVITEPHLVVELEDGVKVYRRP